jgi:hypothetical protein
MTNVIDHNDGIRSHLAGPAQALVAAGLSIIPVGQDKKPTLAWKPYQLRAADGATAAHWFTANGSPPAPALAVICGAISGNLTVIDFDTDHTGATRFDDFAAMVEVCAPGLLGRLVRVATPSGGVHLYLRCAICEGNLKLAVAAPYHWTNPTTGKVEQRQDTWIETRGEGGYAVAPPSPGYRIVHGTLKAIPTIAPEEYAVLMQCARALSAVPIAHATRHTATEARADAGGRPGDAYNAHATVDDVVRLLCAHGWTAGRTHSGKVPMTRPGKDARAGTSGDVTIVDGIPLFTQFSANGGPFEPCCGYSPFGVYALLEHGGDYPAAARALAQQGYGAEPPRTPVAPPAVAEAAPTLPAGTLDDLDAVLARSWPAKRTEREGAALAVAGVLLRGGWTQEDVAGLLGRVATAAGDPMGPIYAAAVALVARRQSREKATGGWPALRKVCGALAAAILEDVVDRAQPEAAPLTWRDRTRSVTELMMKTFPPKRWVVQDLIPWGTLLVAGAPKVGKSIFGWSLAFAVSTGGAAFGKVRVEQRPVLYIAMEDGEEVIQERLLAMAGGPRALPNLQYNSEWRPLFDGGLADLDEYLTEHPGTVVFIDTYEPLRAPDLPTSNAYRGDYRGMHPLTRLAHKHDVPIVIIHHTRKAEHSDVLATINGSNGLAGAVDNIAVLTRTRFGGETVLSLSGRSFKQDRQVALSYDPAVCGHILLGDAEDVRERSLREKIVATLKDGAAKIPEIADAVGRRADSGFRHLLRRLVAEGTLRAYGHGRYGVNTPDAPKQGTLVQGPWRQGDARDACDSVTSDAPEGPESMDSPTATHEGEIGQGDVTTSHMSHNAEPCPRCKRRYSYHPWKDHPGMLICWTCGETKSDEEF